MCGGGTGRGGGYDLGASISKVDISIDDIRYVIST